MSLDILAKAVFAGVAAWAFGILFNIRGVNLLFAGANGALGYLLYLLAVQAGGSNYSGLFVGALAMAALAEVLARLRKCPASVFLVAALIPMVPGGGMFRCMLYLLQGDTAQAASAALATLLDAGAIALAIILVSSLLETAPRRPRLPKKP